MHDPELDPHSRSLGYAERFYWLYDRVSCTNFTVVAELRRPVDATALGEAIDEARWAYPLLDARIRRDEQGRVLLEPGTGTPGDLLVLNRGRGAEDETGITAALDARFPWGNHPLHRFELQPRADGSGCFQATFHHALLDARSGISLVERILERALGGGEIGPRTGFPPNQESLYPQRWRGASARLSAMWMVLRGKLETAGSVQIPFLGQGPRRPLVLDLSLDERQTAGWIERARAEKTTLQGLLAAIQLAALRAEIAGEGERKLTVYHAVDLRPTFEPALSPEELGMFISMLPTSHRLSPGIDLWDLAREVRARLVRGLSRGEAHLTWTGSPPLWLLPADERGSRREQQMLDLLPPMTVVSNVGRVGNPTAALRQAVSSVHFAMGPQTGCPLLSAVTTWAGRLRVNLCIDQERIALEPAHRIRERFRKLLGA